MKAGACPHAPITTNSHTGEDGMMPTLKTARSEAEPVEDNSMARSMVEAPLRDITRRADASVRELSDKFDSYPPLSFRLSRPDIERLVASLQKRDQEDIRFAQRQVRTLATAQKALMQDHAGEGADIMGAVVLLASSASATVTGTSLLIDGGWTAG